ncbi:MAG: hypothetical protein AUK55_10390 [Syntrophobacteraceae bacterium CG2_30_61_12]|nr:MAG: hypothetical protein AUK55_10390 [Syntrophobacteraceae bacterium CG2_30_61_12]
MIIVWAISKALSFDEEHAEHEGIEWLWNKGVFGDEKGRLFQFAYLGGLRVLRGGKELGR